MDLTGANWRRSSGSSADKGCVEIAVNIAGIIAVRDGGDPTGPALTFTADEWTVFATAVRSGHYNERL